jgi:chromate reductase
MPYNVAVVVGSIRKDSFNRRIAKAIIAAAPPSLKFEFIEIGDLPFFSQDSEATPPKQWVDFRAKIKAADALLFATPEYNRSVPGVLKNAIDVGSRPYGQSVWDGKPAAVFSASVGAVGGFGANHHLRQSLAYLNMPTMGQPEAYFGSVSNWFDDSGAIKDPKTTEMLAKFAAAFAKWVETLKK